MTNGGDEPQNETAPFVGVDSSEWSDLLERGRTRGVLHAAGPYRCDVVRVRGRAVATNHPPHGAFRGFGRVETLDVPQSLPRVGGGLGDGGAPSGASDEPAFAPPLMTRTWFHLGTAMWNHHRPFEPYAGDPLLPAISPHVEAPGAHLPADAAAALRLLAGSVVRRERWAVDAREARVDVGFRCARGL